MFRLFFDVVVVDDAFQALVQLAGAHAQAEKQRGADHHHPVQQNPGEDLQAGEVAVEGHGAANQDGNENQSAEDAEALARGVGHVSQTADGNGNKGKEAPAEACGQLRHVGAEAGISVQQGDLAAHVGEQRGAVGPGGFREHHEQRVVDEREERHYAGAMQHDLGRNFSQCEGDVGALLEELFRKPDDGGENEVENFQQQRALFGSLRRGGLGIVCHEETSRIGIGKRNAKLHCT